MPPSAASHPTLQGQSRVALGHGTRAFLLSVAIVVLGGAPSSPLVPWLSSITSSKAAPRFGLVAAAATTIDTAVGDAEHATTKKQQQVKAEEERGLYSWYAERSSSAGRPLGLERKLAPAIVDEELLESDAPQNFANADSGTDLSVLLEGCPLPADATAVKVKHGKPATGNIADHLIDGDPSTW